MSFLLDTDTCSYHIRHPSGLAHRFVQHSGRLWLPSPALAELHAWVNILNRPQKLVRAIDELLADVQVLLFDEQAAEKFGELRGILKRHGVTAGPIDLMIASIALVHDLTVVTHNTSDFQAIPDLRFDDWMK
jgi:tRNA(fMet)-specific endonuclease VapC